MYKKIFKSESHITVIILLLISDLCSITTRLVIIVIFIYMLDFSVFSIICNITIEMILIFLRHLFEICLAKKYSNNYDPEQNKNTDQYDIKCVVFTHLFPHIFHIYGKFIFFNVILYDI